MINSSFRIFLLITILTIVLSSPLILAQPLKNAPFALLKGDELYKQRSDLFKCHEAITYYEQAFSESHNEEIAVRIAKTYYWIGEHSQPDEKQGLFQKGIDWSKRAININPKNAGGYFWLGVNDAKYGEARGILKSLFLIGPIKEAMNQVIAIDPSYEYGGAYRVLGRMYYKLPRFAGGGMDKAVSNLKKSLEYAPNITTTRLFLAETYMAQKDYQRAQQELNVILNAPPIPGLEPEMQQDKASAQQLLLELIKKLTN
jgi:tetratricopeptide (TPR) repeat protein